LNFKYEVSIVIPVYNVEEYLEKCINSLLQQTIDKSKMEIVLVDDGSADSSPAICDKFAEKYDNICVYHKENGGVSSARNCGIENSHGKYIVFLDSDDWLEKKSVKALVNFFNKHYDEVDLVAYEEWKSVDGEEKPVTHFRHKIINKTGIYDINDPEYRYFIQTHMNICIKNKGEETKKFDTEMIFHEDQKFIISIISEKEKIGYCDKARYIYYQNVEGATGSKCHPYYIHNQTIDFWESLFDRENVPEFIQAYFLNDFRWKLHSDVIWPYQYKGEKFEREKNRIVNLLKRVDDDVIDNFPTLPIAHKSYIYQLKYPGEVSIETEQDKYIVSHNGQSLIEFENVEIYLSRFKVKNGNLLFIGVVKCYAANFTDDVKIKASFVGESTETVDLKLKYSSLSICASKTETSNFKMFIIKRPLNALKRIEFKAFVNGAEYPVHCSYAPNSPFCRQLKRESYICENLNIKYNEKRGKTFISFKKASGFNYLKELCKDIRFAKKIGFRNTLTRLQSFSYRKNHRIWLYCDSVKTVKDNAYYQFLHDIKMKDGVERYYVYNPETDIEGWFDGSLKPYLIPYGSLKHRLFGLCADKIITSFYGMRDMLSYPYAAMKYFLDRVNFDVIYLQHGVLHAHLPTMYSLDRMMLDKEVISTRFEEQNMIANYCFEEDFFIKCGMPRYDHVDKTRKAEKKILFAPSWRKFLMRADGKGSWLPREKNFLNSDFYKVTSEFLTNPRLIKFLKDNGYVLDFKLHPIFKCFEEHYKVDGEVVCLAEKSVDEFSYSIFITDFSSFVFDFIYLQRPILYFVPDMDLFEAGLNHYRKIDIPFEDGFGELSTTCEKAVDDVIALIENGCVPEQKYVERMNGLFFDVDNHSEALYNSLMNGQEG